MNVLKISPVKKINMAQIMRQQKSAQRKAQKVAEEAKLNEIIKNAAKSVYGSGNVFVDVNKGFMNESVNDRILGYKSLLDSCHGDWAPWSKSFKKV